MSDASVNLEIVSPRGAIELPPVYAPSPRIDTIEGKRIGLYSNGKHGVNHLFDALETLLKQQCNEVSFVRLSGGFEIKDDDVPEFTSKIDSFIYALGDCGACTFSGVAGTVKLEKLGVPGVFLAGDTFKDRTDTAAVDNAMPAVRYRVIPLADFYKTRTGVDEVMPVAEQCLDPIIDALTMPLTEKETAASQQQRSEGSEPVTVSGSSYGAAAEEFNRVFLEKQMGDGLPLVPPTRERIDWMLSGTARSPEEIVGKLSPKQGIATIEKIAVNAVMAGAKPEYLPVIIAIMEALCDETFDEKHVLLSPNSATLLIVVSGPIAKEIGMGSGIGFMGHGWRANNTIGRAVRLATMNIGHIWPGLNDMGLTGRVSPHTFFTIAENAAMSRWAPYHTDQDFTVEDSCVTVAAIDSASPNENYYGGMIGTWTAEGIIESIANRIVEQDRKRFPEWGNKGAGPVPGSGLGSRNHFIVLFPELVSALNKVEKDRAAVRQDIYEKARVSYDDLSPQELKGLEMALENGVLPDDRKDTFREALKPGGSVPVLISPDNVHLFVAGGVPGCAFSFSYYRVPPFNHTAVLTKKIFK